MKLIMEAWVKNWFEEEFCPIKCYGKYGSIIYPEEGVTSLSKDETIIGEYWFDGNDYCYSLFEEREEEAEKKLRREISLDACCSSEDALDDSDFNMRKQFYEESKENSLRR